MILPNLNYEIDTKKLDLGPNEPNNEPNPNRISKKEVRVFNIIKKKLLL